MCLEQAGGDQAVPEERVGGGGAWFVIHFMSGERGGVQILMQHAASFWFA